jgi:hypothetical protein
MKKLLTTGVFAAAMLTANSASAGEFIAGGLAQSYMTYTTNGQVPTHLSSGYSGVGSLFIQTVSSAATGSGFLCTGSLVNATTVLTAAHCFEGGTTTDPIQSIRFYLPSFGDRAAATTELFMGTGYAYNPGFDNGGITSGNDVALFTLNKAATGHDTYGLYSGDPLNTAYTEVGTGTVGGPSGTDSVAADYKKRTGSNIYEYYGDDIFSDVSHGVVLYDFDDGTFAHDVFGRACFAIGETAATCKNQTGVADESSASPGDSGGPEFINGLIASVTSFGITGGIFQGYCGGNSIDAYNSSRTTAVQTDLSKCTNSSVGEMGGNTLVSYNLDFINAYLNGTVTQTVPVPEPATWAMLILGFGMVGYSLRRRLVKIAVV